MKRPACKASPYICRISVREINILRCRNTRNKLRLGLDLSHAHPFISPLSLSTNSTPCHNTTVSEQPPAAAVRKTEQSSSVSNAWTYSASAVSGKKAIAWSASKRPSQLNKFFGLSILRSPFVTGRAFLCLAGPLGRDDLGIVRNTPKLVQLQSARRRTLTITHQVTSNHKKNQQVIINHKKARRPHREGRTL